MTFSNPREHHLFIDRLKSIATGCAISSLIFFSGLGDKSPEPGG